MTDQASFARFIDAVRPGLSAMVIVGGWAHRLHRLHAAARPLPHPPLMTRDTDVAVGDALRRSGVDLGSRLRDAGFAVDLTGDDVPPVTRYRQGGQESGFYVEFVTPLRGSGVTRNRRPDVTTSIAGVTAQKLRYVELHMIDPWVIPLDALSGFPLSAPAAVQVTFPRSSPVRRECRLAASRLRPGGFFLVADP